MIKKPLNRKNVQCPTGRPIKAVQYGEGNFIRAFVDYVINTLNKKTDFNAGVAVIQPRAGGIVRKLQAQDGLFYLFEKGIQNGKEIQQHELISCIQRCVDPYRDYEAHLKLAEEKELQFIFSNTTEAGIAFDETDTFNEHPHTSFPAKVTALLYRRYQYFKADPTKGVTVIPCELIPDNATCLREIIVKYARFWGLEADFIKWVRTHNNFHNTLVDRIVPGYPKEDIESYRNELDFEDKMLVSSEIFFLWVIEDTQDLTSRIPFHQINKNILLVDDLTPYRTRKVRILNGAHTVMVPFSLLFGNETVKQSLDHPFTGKFVKEAVFEEIIPTLPLRSTELESFANAVFERFKNPFIRHQLSNIGLNSISKFKVRVLPSLLGYHKIKNKLPLRLTFALACLIRFYKGGWEGKTLPVNDSEGVVFFMKDIWKSKDYSQISVKVLSNIDLWSEDLTVVPELEKHIAFSLKAIDHHGVQMGYEEYSARFKYIKNDRGDE